MIKPLLVETITGQAMSEVETRLASVTPDADMVELRLDGVADVDLPRLIVGRRQPLIVTLRARWEGGRFDGSEEERARLLRQALNLGAEYIDVEWRAGFESLIQATRGERIVISAHDFEGVPADLSARVRAMRQTGAEIVKVAVTARSLTETLPLRDITSDRKTVAIAMGDAGVPTRLLAAHFGSRWTYAGNHAAPGQMPSQRVLDEFRFKHVTASTAVFGVVGTRAVDSLSPTMHNAWFQASGIDAIYVPLQTTDFSDFLTFADALHVVGASVTIPFKLDALRCGARADEETLRVGAANTLRRAGEAWEATNTDVHGFLAPLAARDLRGAGVSILGAGGAARAVVVGLISIGARPTVCARRAEQAREVAALGAEIGEWPPRPGSWDVLVNCTPLGGVSAPNESPLPGGPFDGRLVYDLVYRPRETRLMREARSAGCDTIGGLAMLTAQARRQFEWWTGRRSPGVVAPSWSAAHE